MRWLLTTQDDSMEFITFAVGAQDLNHRSPQSQFAYVIMLHFVKPILLACHFCCAGVALARVTGTASGKIRRPFYVMSLLVEVRDYSVSVSWTLLSYF